MEFSVSLSGAGSVFTYFNIVPDRYQGDEQSFRVNLFSLFKGLLNSGFFSVIIFVHFKVYCDTFSVTWLYYYKT